MREIEAVYFDIGETLLDRTREYAAWADFLGLPRHTFSAVFGAMIAAGVGVRDVIARFRPDEPFERLRERIEVPPLAERDLYPDARRALAALRAADRQVGVIGNQPSGVGDEVRALALPADVVLTSADIGVAKPDPRFFETIVERAGVSPERIAYVGDQIDNDVVPALAAGLRAIRLRRGPWGLLTPHADVDQRCLAVLDSLDAVVPVVTGEFVR
ncbi:MAG: HAD family hydrolase [Actinobacteria bacterium]|nr:HAD family hydrolase [Actinomycetota bacterium]